MRQITKGATSQSVYVSVLDSSSSTGGRLTGLVFNTASLTAYYTRNGGSPVAITLATLAAVNSAWASGGFKEVDATHQPGVYRLDLPNAAVASGADSVVITLRGAASMQQADLEVQLTAVDLQTVNQIPDALLDRADAIETGLTLRTALRLLAAAEAGKLSGAATTTVVIRNAVADTKPRITATVDANGNRSAITTDLT